MCNVINDQVRCMSVEPLNRGITIEPGQLAFRVTPRITGEEFDTSIMAPIAYEVLDHVPIADRLHTLQIRCIPFSEQIAHLVFKTHIEKEMGALVYPLVQQITLAAKADGEEPFEFRVAGPSRLSPQMFTDRFTGGQVHFERPDYA